MNTTAWIALGALAVSLASAVLALVGKKGETRITADVSLRGDLLKDNADLRERVDALEATEREQAALIRQQARLIDQQERRIQQLTGRVADLEDQLARTRGGS